MWISVRHCRHLKNHKVTKHGDMILIVLYVDIGKKKLQTPEESQEIKADRHASESCES